MLSYGYFRFWATILNFRSLRELNCYIEFPVLRELHNIENSSVESLDLKNISEAFQKFTAILYACQVLGMSGYWTVIINVRLSSASHNIVNGSNELPQT